MSTELEVVYKKYMEQLERMGEAAMKVYEVCLTGHIPSDSLEELRQAFVALGWLDKEEES